LADAILKLENHKNVFWRLRIVFKIITGF